MQTDTVDKAKIIREIAEEIVKLAGGTVEIDGDREHATVHLPGPKDPAGNSPRVHVRGTWKNKIAAASQDAYCGRQRWAVLARVEAECAINREPTKVARDIFRRVIQPYLSQLWPSKIAEAFAQDDYRRRQVQALQSVVQAFGGTYEPSSQREDLSAWVEHVKIEVSTPDAVELKLSVTPEIAIEIGCLIRSKGV